MQECVNGFSTETQANIFIQSGKSQSSHVRPFYCLSLPLCLHFFLKYFHLFLPPPPSSSFPPLGGKTIHFRSLAAPCTVLQSVPWHCTRARVACVGKENARRPFPTRGASTWWFHVLAPHTSTHFLADFHCTAITNRRNEVDVRVCDVCACTRFLFLTIIHTRGTERDGKSTAVVCTTARKIYLSERRRNWLINSGEIYRRQ